MISKSFSLNSNIIQRSISYIMSSYRQSKKEWQLQRRSKRMKKYDYGYEEDYDHDYVCNDCWVCEHQYDAPQHPRFWRDYRMRCRHFHNPRNYILRNWDWKRSKEDEYRIVPKYQHQKVDIRAELGTINNEISFDIERSSADKGKRILPLFMIPKNNRIMINDSNSNSIVWDAEKYEYKSQIIQGVPNTYEKVLIPVYINGIIICYNTMENGKTMINDAITQALHHFQPQCFVLIKEYLNNDLMYAYFYEMI